MRTPLLALALAATASILSFSGACGSSPGDGSADSGTRTSTGTKAFLEACTTNEECTTGLCYHYEMAGDLCSKTCTVETQATDCPAPSRGCNNRGVCRNPG